jgi:hypothetical protein
MAVCEQDGASICYQVIALNAMPVPFATHPHDLERARWPR